jgi:flagellar motor switch/type III secretory pathway protein FliN
MQAELLQPPARTDAEKVTGIDVASEPPSADFSGLVAVPVSLPRSDSARVACDNHLLAHAACSELALDGTVYRWRWHEAEAAQVQVPEIARLALTQGNTWCTLVLQRESAGGPGFSIGLDGLEGDALRLAAAHRYSALVEHLETLTGGTWQVGAVSRGGMEPARSAGSPLRYGFTLTPTDASAEPALTGQVQMRASELGLWSQVGGHHAPPAPALRGVPVEARVVLAAPPFVTGEQLRALRVGGAVLLGPFENNDIACRLVLPSGVGHCSARLNGTELVLTQHLRVGAPPPLRSSRMPPNLSDPTTESDHPSTVEAALAHLPVALEFEIGKLSIPFGDLAARLVAGHVFDLASALGPESVSLRANGAELARGELLQVGEALAVRITRVVAHGSF